MRKLITLPEDLNRRIEAAAAAQTLSASAWIRQAALEKLAGQSEKPKAKRESK